MPYPESMVAPMRAEMTRCGAVELRTPQDVDAFLAGPGTALLVVNSICGCAGGVARPGVLRALEHDPRPDRVGTVFAGQDLEATARAREHIGRPPSSPAVALFKDGVLAHFVPRQEIEGRMFHEVAADLAAAFDRHCR
jgi:putative YphP/YqiW family bacilliredoxin